MGNDSGPVYTPRPISEVDLAALKLDFSSAEIPLPPRLVSEIPKRIQHMAILAGIVSLFAIIPTLNGWQEEPPYHRALQVVGIVLAVIASVLVVCYVKQFKARTVLLAALCIEVVTCLFISVGNPAYELKMDSTIPGITWIVPIIIMFPFIIPTPPKWTFATSVACVTTVPAGTFIAFLLSNHSGMSPYAIPLAILSPTIAAVIANDGSSLVYEMGVYAEKIRRVGNFRVLEEIGHGGMGIVYRAEHNRLPMRVAIKYINSDQIKKQWNGGENAIKRFTREAGALAELCSPHTVEIYDFGLDNEGKLFYVMELLEGWDLGRLVLESEKGKAAVLPPARAAYLLSQTCRALGEAHALKIVHRDVKPSNIMTCHYGRDRDFVKVLDFGIMTLRKEETEPGHEFFDGHDAESLMSLTGEGRRVGTPDFMSPEQIQNKPVDTSSDIYSLGCVAYFLLTGRIVFEGGDVKERNEKHIKDLPLPPSKKTTQAIPPELEKLIMACLEKLPANRPQNADKLAEDFLKSVPQTWGSAEITDWWTTHGLPKAPATAASSITSPPTTSNSAKKSLWIAAFWRRVSNWV